MAWKRARYQSTYAKSPEAHPIDQLVQNKCAGGLFGILLIAGSGSRIPLGSCVVVDHCPNAFMTSSVLIRAEGSAPFDEGPEWSGP